MSNLEWSELLSVDVDEIDEDHRALLQLFNLLHRALADGDSLEYQLAVLQELLDYAVWHFSHEERLMLKFGYADIEEHRAAHWELIHRAREFQHGFMQAGDGMQADDFAFLERWLTEHILTDDKKLGAFLCQVM